MGYNRNYNVDFTTNVTSNGWWWNDAPRAFSITLHRTATRSDTIRSSTPKGGAKIPLPFATSWSSRRDGTCYMEYWNVPYKIIPASTHTNYPFTHGKNIWVDLTLRDVPSNIWNACVSRVKGKAIGSFDPAVFFAEAPESLRMIGSTVEKLYNGANAFRHGNFRAGARILSGARARLPSHKRLTTPANAWLEYQYGWKPLLNDLHSAFNDFVDKNSREKQESFRDFCHAEGTNTYAATDVKSICKWSARKQLIVFVSSRIPWVAGTLSDPRGVIWEKIPYSFVIDWFVPVGTYLDAAAASSSILGNWVTSSKRTVEFDSFVNLTPNRDGRAVLRMMLPYEHKAGDFTRVISNNPVVELPSFKPIEKISSWQHCANALALLVDTLTDIGTSRHQYRW